jgi:hypothetical protein
MFAGEEDKWRKACKKKSPEDLLLAISDLQEEKKRLETMGPLDTKNDWSKVNRKIEIANRVLQIKERGGFISR